MPADTQSTAIDITGDDSLSYAITALTFGFACHFFSGLLSTLMSVYLPDSVFDLLGTMGTAEVSYVGSYVGSLYIAGWAFGGMLFGWIGDRVGRINTLTIVLLIISVSTLGAVWVADWHLLVALRFITGIGVGATMVLSTVFVAEVWGDRLRERAVAVSILAIGFPIGIIASGSITWLFDDWRSAFMIGWLPLVLSCLFYFFMSEPEQWTELKNNTGIDRKGDKKGSIETLLSPENRTNFIAGGVIFGAMSVGIWSVFSWLPTWAQSLMPSESGGLQEGGTLVILLGLGGIIGCLFSGWLANSIGRRRAMMFAFAGAALAALVLFMGTTQFSSIIYLKTSFLSLFFGVSQGILMGYIPELFPVQVRSTATGICFNAGRMITALAVFFVGVLVPILGGYGNALLIFSLTYILGFTASWFVKETKGKVI